MKNIKKALNVLFLCLVIPLTGCNLSNNKNYKLDITDINNIILNRNNICEANNTYGLYKKGDKITFEIQFFSGLSASLLIDDVVYTPRGDEAWKPQYIEYIMPDHNVDVVSMVNGYVGDEIKLSETIEWGFKITDESLVYIDVQAKYIGVSSEKEDGEGAIIYNEDLMLSSWFKAALIREDNYDIEGGKGFDIAFHLNDETSYDLIIRNDYVSIGNKFYYLSSGLPHAISNID